jgi:hypothetical protein
MTAGRLFVSAGDVVEVQLSADTPPQDPKGRKKKKPKKAPPRRITVKRMRLFLREGDGKDQKYDFEDARLGVRQGQRVAVARGALRGAPEPVNLMLCNLSTGEHEVFEHALTLFLVDKPTFTPFWQGMVMAGAAWIITTLAMFLIITPGVSFAGAAWYGVFVAFVLFWPLWGLAYSWDRMTERGRFRRAREAFIADIEARAKAYAPSLR